MSVPEVEDKVPLESAPLMTGGAGETRSGDRPTGEKPINRDTVVKDKDAHNYRLSASDLETMIVDKGILDPIFCRSAVPL